MDRTIQTRDIYLATAMLTIGFPIETITIKNDHTSTKPVAVFHISKSSSNLQLDKSLEAYMDMFYEDKLASSIGKTLRTFKQLKGRLYSVINKNV